ncbi:hypothetical protein N0V91_005766 [Didymella pomorum]|uniref:Uncharacterized protein n=1 Tax=Didymella pomorum TaxID=749634 RepID=A0A9W9D828_9PLEO|nr:hypothetical protein N0V91_005766 [Didymella pomorum]
MAKKGKGRYARTKGYNQEAYRQAITNLEREWTGREKTCTLAWIWNHATEEERTACENLLKTKNVENTLHADAMKVPTEVKNATSPAPPAVANAARGRGADATGQPAAGGAGPDPQPDTGMTGTAGTPVGPVQSNARVNTTAFDYMPLREDMHRSLLALDEGDLDQAQERTLLEADLEYVASEGKW